MAAAPTRAGEVERLVGALGDEDVTRREAAIARLRVIGARALGRLATLVATDTDPARRSAALKAIEGVDDARGLEIARGALADPSSDVRVAAIGVLRGWLTGDTGAGVLDALSGIALDERQPAAVRTACLDALSDLPPDIVNPLLERVPRDTAAPAIASALANGERDPASVREWLASHDDAPLTTLHALVTAVRAREAAEQSAVRRHEWLLTRGVLHAALARRESRVALYDLRETFDGAQAPLPLDFLAAASAIGDASCLEPMARAWAAAPLAETWWRDRLADTAGEIVHRTRLSGRSAVVKRIRAKWAGFL